MIFFVFVLVGFAPNSLLIPRAHAQTKPWAGVCVGSSDINNPAYGVATIQGIECLLGNVLSVAVTLLGLLAFVMFIVGSFRFLLSGGNAKGTEEGKKTITFAIAGLVLALSAFIILNLISSFTGVQSILHFKIFDSSTNF